MFNCNDYNTNIYIVDTSNNKLKAQLQVGGLEVYCFTKSKEDKKMIENIENTENIQLLQSHINGLRAENEILRDENETLFETNEALIKTIRELRAKINSLESDKITLENKLSNVTLWDLSPEAQEEAGHQLARSLGVGQ